MRRSWTGVGRRLRETREALNGDGEALNCEERHGRAREKCYRTNKMIKVDTEALKSNGKALKCAREALNGDGNVVKGHGEALKINREVTKKTTLA